MNCPKCNAPIDPETQYCMKCEIEEKASFDFMQALLISVWKTAKIVFWIILGLLLFCILGFTIIDGVLPSNAKHVAAKGNDIYRAVLGANMDRETLRLPPVWPKTCLAPTNFPNDISSKVFKTSSDYFYELYDGPNMGTVNHNPYVKGFDYSKLAGAGIPAKVGTGRLTAENNMWLIAANITDDDANIIPVLITRNVDVKEIERLVNCGGATSNLNTKIDIGNGVYKTPFGKDGFVMVRKRGRTVCDTARHATVRDVFDSETLPPRDPSKPPIVYLMP